MPLNVEFLAKFPQWKSVHEAAVEAESNVYVKPRTSLFYSRVTLERVVKWLYKNDDYLRYPPKEKPMLGDLIHERTFRENLSPGMFGPLKVIVKLGNLAVHEDTPIPVKDARLTFDHLFLFLSWLARYYAQPPVKNLKLDESLIPRTGAAPLPESREELVKLEKQIAEKDTKLLEITEENRRLREQLRAKEKERALKPKVEILPENEARTRQLLIDVMLREARWDPERENVQEFAVEGMPNKSGQGYCDYVLWGDDGLPLAVIEAKSTVRKPEEGKQKAVLYADLLQKKGRRPLIFYTNGYETWFWDDRDGPPRRVASFFRKDELEWILQRKETRKPLKDRVINMEIAGRPYQTEAIRRTAEALEAGKRHALLVMATGTGKTRTAIALVDFLKQAGWVRNVLFLADRRVLVNQASGEFKKHLPNETVCNLLEEKGDTSARLYFSTYQTMLNLVEPRPGDPIPFGSGHFDLIIIDEAHRSIYNEFGLIFQYFDALLVGLTATPKVEVHRDTYKFFGLEKGVPTFAYEYAQAVAEGYLVPVKPVEASLKFLKEGIKRGELVKDEQGEYDTKVKNVTGKDIVENSALNAWVFNWDTVRKALRLLMEKGIKVQGGDVLAKTIIFARTQEHARIIVEVFDEMYPHYQGHFAAAVHNNVDYVDRLIEKFKDREKWPQIAVSVDMLDTGVDIPEVANLVMFRPLDSFSKFWQMIGRGTRQCDDLFGPNQSKTHALLFDFCGNVEKFRFQEETETGHRVESITAKLFKQRVDLIRALREKPELEDLRQSLIRTVTLQLENLDEHHFAVRPHLQLVLKYRSPYSWAYIPDEDLKNLNFSLARLVIDDSSEEKKRFDLLMLRLQGAKLGIGEPRQVTSGWNRLKKVGERLLQKQNIHEVKKHAELIQRVVGEGFAEAAKIQELERIRVTLRELLSLLDRVQRVILYTDFTDSLGVITEDGVLPKTHDLSLYQEKVSKFIRKHQDHIAIQKLRKNKSITALDVQAFEEILFAEQVGTREEFEALFGEGGFSFGTFVRSLLGLELEAAREAFADLLGKTTLNANQIHFIQLIIDYLTKNGTLDPGQLMDEPFVALHREGVYGLFDEELVEEIVRVVRFVQKRANVDAG
ncbi:DEAD/DEAH box helicase family protein [Desmospora activa]|uniref:Type I restriction enzyme R subunit n=1 Tax=Desmospora activa DSM 45169 TaxID=1121389 RepID=A0A2T4ZCJ7_9BACL|nr:DEAD/DEAH box helicase family protein [Desmospora activa]PTM59613.1 type I restriction enzyme R subunit [Desmospora activa DSM 45169]